MLNLQTLWLSKPTLFSVQSLSLLQTTLVCSANSPVLCVCVYISIYICVLPTIFPSSQPLSLSTMVFEGENSKTHQASHGQRRQQRWASHRSSGILWCCSKPRQRWHRSDHFFMGSSIKPRVTLRCLHCWAWWVIHHEYQWVSNHHQLVNIKHCCFFSSNYVWIIGCHESYVGAKNHPPVIDFEFVVAWWIYTYTHTYVYKVFMMIEFIFGRFTLPITWWQSALINIISYFFLSVVK